MSPDADVIRELRRRLLAFFDQEARALPWRGRTGPYGVWVSEVMLQQTRVETVVPYFRAWMERFPDVGTLAEAGEDEVLKAWEGLGYYRRARHLHRAARQVRERHGGRVPETADRLRGLPGIGEYTAGAVASIAFGEAVPAVDGNARRVLARLFDLPSPAPSRLRSLAGELVPPDRPGDFNQALMELGATVCSPTSPDCGRCPVSSLCRARARGTVEERPVPRKRSSVGRVELASAVVAAGRRRLLLVRRPSEGLLGGLWAFPEAEVQGGRPAPEVAARAARDAGARVGSGDALELPAVEHAFTHLRATYRPFLFSRPPPAEEVAGEGDGPGRWVGPGEMEELALPVAQRRILELARERLDGPA